MSNAIVTWDTDPRELAANPMATFALDRPGWERLGACFTAFDDELGRQPAIATGLVTTSLGDVEIGVLDYGEATTFLLVSGPHETANAQTSAVIDALTDAHLVAASAVLERLPVQHAAGLDGTQRLIALEAQVAALRHDIRALLSAQRAA